MNEAGYIFIGAPTPDTCAVCGEQVHPVCGGPIQRESREAAADSARLLEVALARIKELEHQNSELRQSVAEARW